MSTKAKWIIGIIAALALIGAFVPDETEKFCNDHPGGRGFKTLDDKYEWVMKCNGGKPAPAGPRATIR